MTRVFYFGVNFAFVNVSGNDVKLSRHERQMMNVWWNFTVVSCVSNISDEFQYPVFDSIVFWYQLNPRKLQILMKNHDAEGVQYLRTKKGKDGKRKIETTPRQDYDQNIKTHASKRQLKKQTQTENEMITQLGTGVSESDRDNEEVIVVANIHKQISANAMKKQPSQDSKQSPVSDHSDENEAGDAEPTGDS